MTDQKRSEPGVTELSSDLLDQVAGGAGADEWGNQTPTPTPPPVGP